MVSMLASSVVDRGFEPLSIHKCGRSWVRALVKPEYKISICCFSSKHASLRSKSKDELSRNQNNVSQLNNMSTRELLFQ